MSANSCDQWTTGLTEETHTGKHTWTGPPYMQDGPGLAHRPPSNFHPQKPQGRPDSLARLSQPDNFMLSYAQDEPKQILDALFWAFVFFSFRFVR